MDGTLIDSGAVVEHLWAEFARTRDLDLTELLEFAHGRRSKDTIARYVSADEVDEVTETMMAVELRTIDGIREVPGAAEFLARMAECVPVAVVTSAPRALACVRLEAAGIAVPEVLVCADDVRQGKPSPEGYLTAARRLGVTPADALGFEDAEAGLTASRAAGLRTVVVGTGQSDLTVSLPRLLDFTRVSARASDGGVWLSRLDHPGGTTP